MALSGNSLDSIIRMDGQIFFKKADLLLKLLGVSGLCLILRAFNVVRAADGQNHND
jgi:hypothetical protein